MKGEDWFKKIDPLFTRFRKRAHEALVPKRDMAIDKLLVQAERRSLHTFQIFNKVAGKGYKVYALCVLGYLFNFVFISRTEKIAEVKKVRGKRLTITMIKQLMHILSHRGEGRVLKIDNFFNTANLLCDLKRENIGNAGTAKAKAGLSKQFPYLRTTLIKNDWGYQAHVTFQEAKEYWEPAGTAKNPGKRRKQIKRTKEKKQTVNCTAFQDINTVFFMSTVHSSEDFKKQEINDPEKEVYNPQKDRVKRKDVQNHDKDLQKAGKPLDFPKLLD